MCKKRGFILTVWEKASLETPLILMENDYTTRYK